MKTLNFIIILLIVAVTFSCKSKDETTPNGGGTTQGKLGDVGNEWTAKFNNDQDVSGKIIANDNGIVTIVLHLGNEVDTVKVKITENGLYGFFHSPGDLTKPFTLVEWNAQVGDEYLFNMGDLYFSRYVSEIETYWVPALNQSVEMIGVYEEIPYQLEYELFGYSIASVTCYWHPTYGLVCVDIWTTDGQFFSIKFLQIEL